MGHRSYGKPKAIWEITKDRYIVEKRRKLGGAALKKTPLIEMREFRVVKVSPADYRIGCACCLARRHSPFLLLEE